MADPSRGIEEHYVLRVLDPDLQAELSERLATAPSEEALPPCHLRFSDDDRRATFEFAGRRYPARIVDLPTVVESYKSYDDVNLVKTADVGQVVLVGDDEKLLEEAARREAEGGGGGDAPPPSSSLLAQPFPASYPPVPVDFGVARASRDPNELRDGLTPAMRDVRGRIFRPEIRASPAAVSKVAHDILNILAGGSPANVRFVDYEEIWEIDPETGQGRWVQVGTQGAAGGGAAN